MIKKLYNDYFQKSKIFLYPFLLVPKGSSVSPINTYTSLEGYCTHSDTKLVCQYHIRDDNTYKVFEKRHLLGNQFFHEFFEAPDNIGLYIFDLQDFKSDWDKVIDGKYSQLSKEAKSIILTYYLNSKSNYTYVDSYLNPEDHFESYAKLLGCSPKLLKSVGELCNKPDFTKETITVSIKDLGFVVDLPQ
jgi:hypothetical protein